MWEVEIFPFFFFFFVVGVGRLMFWKRRFEKVRLH